MSAGAPASSRPVARTRDWKKTGGLGAGAPAVTLALFLAGAAFADPAPRPDQLAFRGLYKELVETNTSLSVGSCTLAAERMAARLKAAGYPDANVWLFATPEHPKEGGLVAWLPGTDPKAKPMLLLAHIDVVEAKREDWTRDPFTLIEENGYFYARGTSDDKAEAAVWTDTLIRLKQEGFKPRRTIKMALTCGEETGGAFNGAEWLSTNKRDLIDAAFALNEGGGGRLDTDGKPVAHAIEAGEKFYEDYTLTVTNPGGHSSRPSKDNAIYRLAGALQRIGAYDFPVEFTDASKTFFTRMGAMTGGKLGEAMVTIVKDPANGEALATVAADPGYNGMLRTTCVATMISGGHATNALPQRATANVNCRIFPGTSIETVRDKLIALVNDPKVTVTPVMDSGERIPSSPPPLTPEIMGPIEKLSAQFWPGVPVLPVLVAGATDGIYLAHAGIPTYGVSGMFADPDGGGIHGLNERIRVKSLYDGRDFLYALVKIYADQK